MKRSKGQSPEKSRKIKKNAPTIQGKPSAKRDRNTVKSVGSGPHFDPVKIGLIILLAAAVGIGTAVYLTYTQTPPQQAEDVQTERELRNSDLPAEQTDSAQAEQSPET